MLRILAYHRVAERNDPMLDSRTVSVTPVHFVEQMRYVSKHYRAISVRDVLEALITERSLPQRSVLITFDDAYTDFAETAWPVLKRFGLPATLFVPTGYAGQPERGFWWDRLHGAFQNSTQALLGTPFGTLSLATPEQRRRSLRLFQDYLKTIPAQDVENLVDSACRQRAETQLPYRAILSWHELRQLAKEGVTLGSHTQTHAILTQLAPEKVRDEIRSSQEDLQREIGFVLPIFCYPNGAENDTVKAIMQEEGIVLGFTTSTGINDLETANLLGLKRIVVTPRTSLPILALRLLRVGSYVDSWRLRRQKAPTETWAGHPLAPHRTPVGNFRNI